MFSRFRSKKPEADSAEADAAVAADTATTTATDESPKVYLPFDAAPLTIAVPAAPDLTQSQMSLLQSVYRHFADPQLKVPCTEEDCKKDAPPVKPLDENEKAWLSRECFLRYLRATKWDSKEAIARITLTLAWRRGYGIAGTEDTNELNAALVSEENETGKEVLLGFDIVGHPCLYLKPGRQNTKPTERQVQQMVYMLERSVDFMPSGQDALALLIDFKLHASGTHDSKLPSLSMARSVLHILQTHYPERLGKALLGNISWLAWTTLKLIHPFIDPMTREKLVYDKPFTEFVPASQLDCDFGGDVRFEYDHAKYWPELARMAREKRARYMDRFRRFGGVVGLSEADMRGDNGVLTYPVSQLQEDKKKKEEANKKKEEDKKEEDKKEEAKKEEDKKEEANKEEDKKEEATKQQELESMKETNEVKDKEAKVAKTGKEHDVTRQDKKAPDEDTTKKETVETLDKVQEKLQHAAAEAVPSIETVPGKVEDAVTETARSLAKKL